MQSHPKTTIINHQSSIVNRQSSISIQKKKLYIHKMYQSAAEIEADRIDIHRRHLNYLPLIQQKIEDKYLDEALKAIDEVLLKSNVCPLCHDFLPVLYRKKAEVYHSWGRMEEAAALREQAAELERISLERTAALALETAAALESERNSSS